MVRKCVVPGCAHTDVSMLAHRFPRRHESAVTWQIALGLEHIPIHDLVSRHVVCTEHFKTSDYRNAMSNSLNFTACPSLSNQADRFEIVEPKELGHVEIVPTPPPHFPRLPNDVSVRKVKNRQTKVHIVTPVDEDDSASVEVIEIREEFDEVEELETENEIILVGPPKTNHNRSLDRSGLPMNVLHLYPSTSESPVAKRIRPVSPQDEPLLYASISVQTDDDVEEKEIEESYPQYKSMTKLEILELLKRRDDKISELENKCDKLKQIIQNW